MTRLNLESIVSSTLILHLAEQTTGQYCNGGEWEVLCSCGHFSKFKGTSDLDDVAHAKHQSEKVIEALIKENHIEWALQQQTYIDGEFDRTYLSEGITSKKFTEKDVKNHRWLSPKSRIPTRIVSRLTGNWTPVKPELKDASWRIINEPEEYFAEARRLAYETITKPIIDKD